MDRRIRRSGGRSQPPERSQKQEVIGVLGTGRCVGTTHFAVLAAGYFSGVQRKSCAVLEWNRHGDFSRLEKLCKGIKSKDHGCRIMDARYYKDAGIETLLMCKTLGYQSVIVDYGAVSDGNLEEFLRCDRQFVLGSLTEWQLEEFCQFVENGKRKKRSWQALTVFGSDEARRNMERGLRLSVKRIPFSADAFVITGELISFFEELL